MKIIILFNKKRFFLITVLFLASVTAASFLLKYRNEPATVAASPIYRGSPDGKKIAITFNVVWGEEYIPQILETLKDSNTRATFFVGGQWAEDFPELVSEIAKHGHEIGNHGYSHPHPDRISRLSNFKQIVKTEEVLTSITGSISKIYAPPYGERGDAVLAAAEDAGYTTVLWSIDTIDWQKPAPSVIVRRVVEKAHNGAIVLMHPTAPTVHALPVVIRELKKQEFELVNVSSMIEDLKKQGVH